MRCLSGSCYHDDCLDVELEIGTPGEKGPGKVDEVGPLGINPSAGAFHAGCLY